nr:MAG TPA: hypothetical protein [Caudoviricetes sp.]
MNPISLAPTFHIIKTPSLFTIHIGQSYSPRFLKFVYKKTT